MTPSPLELLSELLINDFYWLQCCHDAFGHTLKDRSDRLDKLAETLLVIDSLNDNRILQIELPKQRIAQLAGAAIAHDALVSGNARQTCLLGLLCDLHVERMLTIAVCIALIDSEFIFHT
jgi:hypothetical protein